MAQSLKSQRNTAVKFECVALREQRAAVLSQSRVECSEQSSGSPLERVVRCVECVVSAALNVGRVADCKIK